MRKCILFLCFGVVVFGHAYAQKRVLLEDFTGTACTSCPLGAYYVDSMAIKYPDVIPVCLHTYSAADSMFFPTIDTIGQAYTSGAPLGAIDRKHHAPTTAVNLNQWDADIQQQLAVTPKVDVLLSAVWDSATRDIATELQVGILADLDTGDYRMGLYIVEDSVKGTGSGYDQSNIYNTTVGSPFFGMGNPIVHYVHRHVVRALLPAAWGTQGVITSTPAMGETYAHIFHYTLPANYDEHIISLVAFVYAYTANHTGDSVLNAAQEKLVIHPAVAAVLGHKANTFSIYPNPSAGVMTFSSGTDKTYTLWLTNIFGQAILEKEFTNSINVSRTELKRAGVYFAKIMQGGKQVAAKTITFLD